MDEIVSISNTEAMPEVAEVKNAAAMCVKRAMSMIVASDDDAAEATTLLSQIADCKRRISSIKDAIKRPIRAGLTALDAMFGTIESPLKAADERLRQSFAAYQAKKREAALKEAARLQKQMERKAEKTGAAIPVEIKPIIQKTVAGEGGGAATMREDWAWDVADEAKIPRQFLAIDRAAITKAVRAGVREIPGIKIYKRLGVTVR